MQDDEILEKDDEQSDFEAFEAYLKRYYDEQRKAEEDDEIKEA